MQYLLSITVRVQGYPEKDALQRRPTILNSMLKLENVLVLYLLHVPR